MIRFRRWNRKSYSMFASLGKCVTIGQVCKSIAEASLSKNTSLCNTRTATDTPDKAPDSSPTLREQMDFLIQELLTSNIASPCSLASDKVNITIPIYYLTEKATQEIASTFPVLPFFFSSHYYD